MNNTNWYTPLKKRKKKKFILPIVICAVIVSIIGFSTFVFVTDTNSSDENDTIIPKTASEFFDSYYTSVSTGVDSVSIPEYDKETNFQITVTDDKSELFDLPDLYSNCSSCVVGIESYANDSDEPSYWGSGIIISENGFILTNAHIISDCYRADIILYDGREFQSYLVGSDSISDLAVLKIDCNDLDCATFGNSDSIRVGEKCASIGNPLSGNFSLTLTDGIISAINRDVIYKGHAMTLLQTNTAINEGNSGGALFNMYGQVIGVTNMKMMSNYSSIEGIGFAIPSNNCKKIANDLLNYGYVKGRTSLGITVGYIPDEAKSLYNLPDGLYVMEVTETSDAYSKGIKKGDVIVSVNGENCTSTTEINLIKDELDVGDSLILTIFRDNDTIDIEIELMDYKNIYG